MLGKTRVMLVGLVVAAAAINIAQFRTIDASADGGYSALTRLSSTDIMVSTMENPVIEQSYGLFLALADVAPGSTILVSDTGSIPIPAFRDHMLGFGDAKSVQTAGFTETANKFLDPDELLATPEKYSIAATGSQLVEGHTVTRWQIVTGACASDSAPEFAAMFLGTQDSRVMLLLETCLLPEGTVDAK